MYLLIITIDRNLSLRITLNKNIYTITYSTTDVVI